MAANKRLRKRAFNCIQAHTRCDDMSLGTNIEHFVAGLKIQYIIVGNTLNRFSGCNQQKRMTSVHTLHDIATNYDPLIKAVNP